MPSVESTITAKLSRTSSSTMWSHWARRSRWPRLVEDNAGEFATVVTFDTNAALVDAIRPAT